MSKMGKKRLEPYAYGLGIKTSDFAVPTAWRVNAGTLESFAIVQTHAGDPGAGGPIVYAGEAATISN